jgi:hypothetical protein
MKTKPKKSGLRRGTVVIWPGGVEEMYGISAVTRWRWEKSGRLPARDFDLRGKSGWRPETLAQAETAKAAAA